MHDGCQPPSRLKTQCTRSRRPAFREALRRELSSARSHQETTPGCRAQSPVPAKPARRPWAHLPHLGMSSERDLQGQARRTRCSSDQRLKHSSSGGRWISSAAGMPSRQMAHDGPPSGHPVQSINDFDSYPTIVDLVGWDRDDTPQSARFPGMSRSDGTWSEAR